MSADKQNPSEASLRSTTIQSIRELLTPKAIAPSKEDLQAAAEKLKSVVPYNFEAWRLHADLLLTALQELQSRELQTDASFLVLGTPLQEDDLRNAAEQALRQCAHFADSAEKAIASVDEANKVRKLTWL